ncbi:MAG: ThiF family adenylyltransferase [Kofleriaceae bacterium]
MKATVVGAGGLGGPLALALGAAGVDLVIVDPDVVEVSNLHRQIQFTAADLGAAKATTLATRVAEGGGQAKGYKLRWVAEDADDISGDSDLIVDGSDDPETKFAVADWAVARGKPYVIAAALQYGGNVLVGGPGTACYRCFFEEPVPGATCASAGVLGPIVGAIGGVAAALALVALRDRPHGNLGTLFVFDDLRVASDPRIVRFSPRAGCPACARQKVA